MKNRTGTRPGIGARLRIAALVLTAAAAVVGSGLTPAASADTPSASASAAAAASDTTCAPSGEGGTTCTNSYSGDTAFDWYADGGSGGMTGLTPSVTVDQTTNLTNQIVHVSWKNFTPSMTSYDEPGYVQGQEFYPVAIEECAGTDPTYADNDCNTVMVGGPSVNGAPGNAVETYTLSGTSSQLTDCSIVPSDTVCGTGYADIQVQTRLQNATLGCDQTHPCSIVVLPVWGGNWSTPPDCEDHSDDIPDNAADTFDPWNRVCAWDDSFVVPISFAPLPSTYCPAADYSFTAAGSSALEKAMGQWQPSWCQSGSGHDQVDFDYNSAVNEYQARQQFLASAQAATSSVDTALVTDPASSSVTAGSTRKFTYAPIATTAISIAYYVDNNTTQEPVTDIKLDARLVAKLLTQSYSLEFGTCPAGQTSESVSCDPAVSGNPTTIFQDPEFYQLNPEYTEADFAATASAAQSGAFLPIVLSGDSDMTWELTRWIASDPDALAFLEGKPDQWGMHVNTNYEKFSYPLSSFVEQDPGWTNPNDFNQPYYKTMQETWIPVTGVDNVAADLAAWQSSALQFAGTCPNSVNQPPCPDGVLPSNPRQTAEAFPRRALFAVMDSGTAASYRFPTAELVNPAGNAEAPTTDSMAAAVSAMKTNPDGVTQYQDYDATSANAYPLTEVQYAMVPTCGLTSAKANAIANFLTDAADSQVYGISLGQLPPWGGYLALDAAQQQKTVAAATAVRAQNCKSTSPDTTVSGKKPTTGAGGGTTTITTVSGGGSPGSATGAGTGGGTTSTTPTTGAVPTAATATGSSSPSASASASASPTPVGFGYKAADTSSDVKVILPVALAAGALLAIGGPLAYAFGSGGLRRPKLSAPWRRGAGSAAPDPGTETQTPDSGAGPTGGGDLDG